MRIARRPLRRSASSRSPSKLFPKIVLLIAIGSASPAANPTASVQISGTVRDAESGAAVANAIVSLAGAHRIVFTDEQGRYELEATPGPQRVTVQRLGYAPQQFEAIVPAQGVLEINVELRCEPIPLPPIEVRARVPIQGLEPGNGVEFPNKSITQDALYQHPLLAEPDVLRAVGGGEVVLEPESPGGIHIRGGASDQVDYLLDGIPVFSPFHTGGTYGAWNPDAVSRVDLITVSPVPASQGVLSGTVSARTREPGPVFGTRGSVSASQARAMVDGPVGPEGMGYLASVTSAFPGLVYHKQESSQLRGENFDWLGKIVSPLFGGRLRLLGYGSQTEINTAAYVEAGDTSAFDATRNEFMWDSRSLGVEWARSLGGASLVLRSWAAFGNAEAQWAGTVAPTHLSSRRRERGFLAMVDVPFGGGTTSSAIRAHQSEITYRFRPTSGGAYALSATTPVISLFLDHKRNVTGRTTLDVSLTTAFATGGVHLSPTAQLCYRPVKTWLFSATAIRRHQFVQSLRNPESVVSRIFPVDLHVGAGAGGVPVASSDLLVAAAEHRPNGWLRVGCQAYAREFDGLALVAPQNPDPFAADGFVGGTGDAHGFVLEGGASGGQYGILASYGYQRVELEYASGEYVPGYGAVHSIAAGIIVLPAPTYTLRIGYESVLGRRATTTLGAFEWESSNMLDLGTEFAGTPGLWTDAVGGARLPGYHRLDLGIRKRWRATLGGRDGLVEVFGTLTNILGRTNVLTEAVDPATGERNSIEMRPLSPLVVGLDWRF